MFELNGTMERNHRRLRGGNPAGALFDAAFPWNDTDGGRVVTRSRQVGSDFACDDGHAAEWHAEESAPAPAARNVHVHRSDSLWTSDIQPFLPAQLRHHNGQLSERITSEAFQDLDTHRLNVAIDVYSKALRDLLPAPVCQEIEFVQAEDDSFYRLTVLVEPGLYAEAARLVELHLRVEDTISLIAPEFEGYFSLRFRGSNGAS